MHHRILIVASLILGSLPAFLGPDNLAPPCPNNAACVNGICAGSYAPKLELTRPPFAGTPIQFTTSAYGTNAAGQKVVFYYLWEEGTELTCPNGTRIGSSKLISVTEYLVLTPSQPTGVVPPQTGGEPPPATPPAGSGTTSSGHTNCSGFVTGSPDTWPDIRAYFAFISKSSSWIKTNCSTAGAGCLSFVLRVTLKVIQDPNNPTEKKVSVVKTVAEHVAKIVSPGNWKHKPGHNPVIEEPANSGRTKFDRAICNATKNGDELSGFPGTSIRFKAGTKGTNVGDTWTGTMVVCYCPVQ